MSDAQAKPSGGRTLFRIVIFVLLVLMLLAVAQDRLRARPNVEAAYNQVESLVQTINLSAENRATTSTDVQEALGREPDDVMQEGPFTVEVYSWRAGLPWRTHDYYVVYAPAKDNKRLFVMSHYKYALDREDLQYITRAPAESSDEGDLEMPELMTGEDEPDGESESESQATEAESDSAIAEPVDE